MNSRLRNLKAPDSPLIGQMLSQIPEFNLEDQSLAMELVHIALEQPGQKDYAFIIAASQDDQPRGFACFGPTPLTKGTFDLYWIAVDSSCAGQGIGTMLLKAVEERIEEVKGRMLVIETSSGHMYARTRQFYLKNGYTRVECLPDFYQDGEDRITFAKRFL